MEHTVPVNLGLSQPSRVSALPGAFQLCVLHRVLFLLRALRCSGSPSAVFSPIGVS